MGEVYRARDTRLGRTVAIKVLRSHVAVDEPARERFEREARVIAGLNHPHICTLYDVGTYRASIGDGPVPYLVMEFVNGETLADRLSRGTLSGRGRARPAPSRLHRRSTRRIAPPSSIVI